MLDFSSVKSGSASFADIAADLTKADLYRMTDEMIDIMQKIVVDATNADVVFAPQDPNANDTYGNAADKELAWTLGHVIVHVTATSEESAALALTLARGLEVEGRSRYETPWESVTTAAQIHQRLEESRHMRKAMLNAWPEKPNLEITTTPFPQVGALNAVGRFILGLYHDADHIDQLKEIMRQAHEVRA